MALIEPGTTSSGGPSPETSSLPRIGSRTFRIPDTSGEVRGDRGVRVCVMCLVHIGEQAEEDGACGRREGLCCRGLVAAALLRRLVFLATSPGRFASKYAHAQ